jgi:hypothetical protein
MGVARLIREVENNPLACPVSWRLILDAMGQLPKMKLNGDHLHSDTGGKN